MDPALLLAAFKEQQKAKKAQKKDKKKTSKNDSKSSGGSKASGKAPAGSSFDSFGETKEAKRKRQAKEKKEKKDDDGSEDDDEDISEDSEPRRRYEFLMTWTNPPEELKTRKETKDMTAREYVEHFARYVIGKWESELQLGKPILSTEKNKLAAEAVHVFSSKKSLEETKDSLKRLVEDCRKNKAPDKIIGHLEKMAALAAEQEYAEAVKAYVEMTVGKKAWHQPCLQLRVQQNHGGAIKEIIKADADTDFDSQPHINSYCQACKRLVQFCQYLKPNDLMDKNCF